MNWHGRNGGPPAGKGPYGRDDPGVRLTATPPPGTPKVVLQSSVPGSGEWTSNVIGAPPAGKRWRLVSASVALDARVPSPHTQHIFLWTEFLPAPNLPNPNQDFLARIHLEAGQTGQFQSRGGYGPTATGVFHYTAWNQPIYLVPGTAVKFDSDAPPGNTASYEVVFEEEGPADSMLLFHYHYAQDGSLQTWNLGSPAAGTYWRLEFATVGIRFGPSNGPRLARMLRRPDGRVLSDLTKFTLSLDRSRTLDATGGYSTEQTGPSSGSMGSQTVWKDRVYVGPADSLEVRLQGPSGDKGHYAVAISRFTGSPPASP